MVQRAVYYIYCSLVQPGLLDILQFSSAWFTVYCSFVQRGLLDILQFGNRVYNILQLVQRVLLYLPQFSSAWCTCVTILQFNSARFTIYCSLVQLGLLDILQFS